jgi:hypothetical protein
MTYQVAGPIEAWDATKGQRILSLSGTLQRSGCADLQC